nr:IS21 family transposase [Pseudogulbenkiania subflava]
METIGKIRRRHLVNGERISAIARSLNLSCNTVNKYLNATAEPTYQRQRQPKPQLGPSKKRWSSSLSSAGLSLRRSDVPPADYSNVCRPEGYRGAYDSIQRYVRTWNASATKIIRSQAFVPLSFAPGEVGQFDWSYEHVVLGGVTQTIKLAHFRLTYSRQMFVVAYPRETQEMVFDAHNRAFAFFGGVPHKMVYDNLKTVVEAVLPARIASSTSASWRWRIITCSSRPPARAGFQLGEGPGGESGGQHPRVAVHATPPRFADFSGLNQWLETRYQELAGRRHPTQDATIADVLKVERPHLRPVTMPFDGYVEQLLRVSSTCVSVWIATVIACPPNGLARWSRCALAPTRLVS